MIHTKKAVGGVRKKSSCLYSKLVMLCYWIHLFHKKARQKLSIVIFYLMYHEDVLLNYACFVFFFRDMNLMTLLATVLLSWDCAFRIIIPAVNRLRVNVMKRVGDLMYFNTIRRRIVPNLFSTSREHLDPSCTAVAKCDKQTTVVKNKRKSIDENNNSMFEKYSKSLTYIQPKFNCSWDLNLAVLPILKYQVQDLYYKETTVVKNKKKSMDENISSLLGNYSKSLIYIHQKFNCRSDLNLTISSNTKDIVRDLSQFLNNSMIVLITFTDNHSLIRNFQKYLLMQFKVINPSQANVFKATKLFICIKIIKMHNSLENMNSLNDTMCLSRTADTLKYPDAVIICIDDTFLSKFSKSSIKVVQLIMTQSAIFESSEIFSVIESNFIETNQLNQSINTATILHNNRYKITSNTNYITKMNRKRKTSGCFEDGTLTKKRNTASHFFITRDKRPEDTDSHNVCMGQLNIKQVLAEFRLCAKREGHKSKSQQLKVKENMHEEKKSNISATNHTNYRTSTGAASTWTFVKLVYSTSFYPFRVDFIFFDFMRRENIKSAVFRL